MFSAAQLLVRESTYYVTPSGEGVGCDVTDIAICSKQMNNVEYIENIGSNYHEEKCDVKCGSSLDTNTKFNFYDLFYNIFP